jgi:hypothetical protein
VAVRQGDFHLCAIFEQNNIVQKQMVATNGRGDPFAFADFRATTDFCE